MSNVWEEAYEQTRAGAVDDIEPEVEDQLDPEEFIDDSPVSSDLVALLQLGALTTEATLRGHKFVLRTLTIGEELIVGMVADRYKDSMESGRAYITAVVAAIIVSVNGRSLVGPSVGPETDIEIMERRFKYITKKFYWPVIRAIYQEYGNLIRRQEEAFVELEKK